MTKIFKMATAGLERGLSPECACLASPRTGVQSWEPLLTENKQACCLRLVILALGRERSIDPGAHCPFGLAYGTHSRPVRDPVSNNKGGSGCLRNNTQDYTLASTGTQCIHTCAHAHACTHTVKRWWKETIQPKVRPGRLHRGTCIAEAPSLRYRL